LLAGALLMRLLNAKDKATIAKLTTDLAVSAEILKLLQTKETEFRQLQQFYIETKTTNAELQTRIHEQVKNTDDAERIAALKQHTEAGRTHIKSLSYKDYSGLKGLRSLHFVLLFMPIEAAFIAAFQADEGITEQTGLETDKSQNQSGF
jgi:hypothetical protein